MRVLPLAFYIDNLNYDEIYNLIVSYAAITHGHIRSHMACFILVVYANKLMHLKEVSKIAKTKCFAYTMTDIHNYFISQKRFEIELIYFERFFSTFPNKLKDIKNSGYVIDSLESSFSSFLKFNRYEMIVIDAIKKGGDTDTNACISGGLAGIFYGSDNIPKKWIEGLLRKEDIIYLSEKWAKSLIEKL